MLLVSTPNLPAPAQTALLAMDRLTGCVTAVDIGCMSGGVRSGLGLARHGDLLWVVHMDDQWQPHVAVLDATSLLPLSDHPLEGAVDPHSLCAWRDGFALASSGTDEVLAYRWSDGKLEPLGPVWSASDSGRDDSHLNSVAVWQGRLVCSGFGSRVDGSWSGASDGWVAELPTGRRLLTGLRHPHTVTPDGQRLLVCESAAGRVLQVHAHEVADEAVTGDRAEVILQQEGAYLRGLTCDPDYLNVGTSLSRNRSKSRGVPLTLAERRSGAGSSSVLQSVLGVTTPLGTLPDWAPEVYDLLAL